MNGARGGKFAANCHSYCFSLVASLLQELTPQSTNLTLRLSPTGCPIANWFSQMPRVRDTQMFTLSCTHSRVTQ